LPVVSSETKSSSVKENENGDTLVNTERLSEMPNPEEDLLPLVRILSELLEDRIRIDVKYIRGRIVLLPHLLDFGIAFLVLPRRRNRSR